MEVGLFLGWLDHLLAVTVLIIAHYFAGEGSRVGADGFGGDRDTMQR